MNFKDRILNFQRYALTNMTSVYQEDAMTAQELNIKTAQKIVECLKEVEVLATAIENIKKFLQMEYEDQSEELVINIEQAVADIKTQVNNSYIHVFDENAMTASELAGCMARNVNECLKAVNMLSDLVLEINDNIITYDIGAEMLTIGGENS